MESKELKQRRERLGMTQAELADVLGVAENTVWRYEKGATSIPKHMSLTLEALEARHIETLKQPIQEAGK
ncbi:MAG TPA: helix-turn-helix domain-containing protein [Pyrinomonadaceae bacterium]|jgi:transcriptional regulator with XRE-family HTH domain